MGRLVVLQGTFGSNIEDGIMGMIDHNKYILSKLLAAQSESDTPDNYSERIGFYRALIIEEVIDQNKPDTTLAEQLEAEASEQFEAMSDDEKAAVIGSLPKNMLYDEEQSDEPTEQIETSLSFATNEIMEIDDLYDLSVWHTLQKQEQDELAAYRFMLLKILRDQDETSPVPIRPEIVNTIQQRVFGNGA